MADDTRSDGTQSGNASGFQPTVINFSREAGKSDMPPHDFATAAADWTTGGIALDPVTPRGGGWRLGIGLVLSSAWLAFGAAYLMERSDGLEALLSLPPLHLAMLAATALMPLMILWLTLALFGRDASYRAEALALRRHLALLAFPAEAAEERIALISDSLRTQTRDLSGATRDAAMQTETLRATLSRESRELLRVASHVDQETLEALNKLGERAKGLADVMERLRTASDTTDHILSQRQEALDRASEKTQRSAEVLSTTLDRQSTALTSTASDINRQAAVVEALVLRQERGLSETRAAASSFAQAAEALTGVVTKASDILATRASMMDQAVSRLEDRGGSLAKTLDAAHAQSESLEGMLEVRAAALDEQTRKLAETARTAITEIDGATAAAVGDFTAFREGAGGVLEGARKAAAAVRETAQQADKVRHLLQAQSSGLEASAVKLSGEIRAAGTAMQEQQSALAQTTERSTERIRHVSDLLARNAVDITRTTARASVEIETVSEGLRKSMGDVTASADVLRSAARDVAEASAQATASVGEATFGIHQGLDAVNSASAAFCDETDRLAEAARVAVETLDSLGEGTRKEIDAIASLTARAIESLKGEHEAMTQSLDDFLTSVEEKTGRAEKAGESLRASLGLVTEDAKRSIDLLTSTGGGLRAQVDALAGVTEAALDRLEAASKLMKKESGALNGIQTVTTEKAKAAATELAQVAENLSAAARAAEQHAHDLKKARDAVDVQRFMAECSYVIERLQAAAVDITRLFTPDLEEDLWKRFYKGEHNVFMRQAARTITRAQTSAVKRLFAENKEFRQYATRYLGEFEGILKAARGNDRAEILTAVFTGSDMGRLYLVLAKALGKGE